MGLVPDSYTCIFIILESDNLNSFFPMQIEKICHILLTLFSLSQMSGRGDYEGALSVLPRFCPEDVTSLINASMSSAVQDAVIAFSSSIYWRRAC